MPSNVAIDIVTGNKVTVVSVTESVPTTQAFPLQENYQLHQQNIASNAAAMASEAQQNTRGNAKTNQRITSICPNEIFLTKSESCGLFDQIDC